MDESCIHSFKEETKIISIGKKIIDNNVVWDVDQQFDEICPKWLYK